MKPQHNYLHCANGHVYHMSKATPVPVDGTIQLNCPHCGVVQSKLVPEAVLDAIKARFDGTQMTSILLEQLKYDGMNGCYYYHWMGMYVGVENNGYMHT